ncbi:unnamed protein product, partial [Scytosiphon promiscuus]
ERGRRRALSPIFSSATGACCAASSVRSPCAASAPGNPPRIAPQFLGSVSPTSRRCSCRRCAANAQATLARSCSGPTRADRWSVPSSLRGTAPCSRGRTRVSCATRLDCSRPDAENYLIKEAIFSGGWVG